jgi:hypothetical protein
MPPVIAAIAGGIISIASAVGVTLTVAVATDLAYGLILLVAIVGSIFLAPKPNTTSSTSIDLKLDPTMPRQILVGEIATGGSVVWAFTYSDNSTPNDYLVRVISLSDFPCTGLSAITEGSSQYGQLNYVLSFSGDPTTGWVSCNQHQDGGPNMWVRVYLGRFADSAIASVTYTRSPDNGNNIVIGANTITYVTATPTAPNQIQITGDLDTDVANTAALINSNVTLYEVTATASGGVLSLVAPAGPQGNSLGLSTNGTGHINISGSHFTGGSGPTADANLISWSGGQWTANHMGIGQCYAIVKYKYSTVAFPNGEPQLVWVLDGAPVYDQRDDSTRTDPTRTGSQRLNDPTTWVYSQNTAVLTQQVLRGFYLNGQLLYGCGASDTDVPDAMLLAAYNTCDIAVPTPTGGTEPQYIAGTVLTASDTASTGLGDLIAAMDGNLYDRGGIITLYPGGSRTPVFELTDTDVVWEEEKSWQPKSGLDTLFNSLMGTYLPASQEYIDTPFPVLWSPDWDAQDGGQRIVRQITYRAITSDTQLQRINLRVWNSSRFQGVLGFVTNLQGLQLEQGDWFQFTSQRWGFSDKYFIASQVNILQNLRIQIVGQEISPTIDGWVPAYDYVTWSGTTRADTSQNLPSYEVPGANLLYDTEFQRGTVYWGLEPDTIGVTLKFSVNQGSFFSASQNVLGATNSGGTPTSGHVFVIFGQFFGTDNTPTPCIPGQSFSVSVAVATYGLNAKLYVAYQDEFGVAISGSFSLVAQSGVMNTGGVNGDNFMTIAGIVTVPEDGTFAGYNCRAIYFEVDGVSDGTTSPQLYMCQPYLALCKNGQTQPSGYTPGRTDPTVPINVPLGQGAIFNPVAPLSSSSSTSISIAACTITTAWQTYTLPSGTITGLANGTAYSVFWDTATSTYSAVSSAATSYYSSTSTYLALGVQYTQSSGGGYPPPPPLPPGGGGGQGGGQFCVVWNMWTPNGVQAHEVKAGDLLKVLNEERNGYEEAEVLSAKMDNQLCVRLTTESGAEVECTYHTPIMQPNGSAVMADSSWYFMAAVLHDKEMVWEKITDITNLGIQRVACIDLGGRSYAAGSFLGSYIFTHNTSQIP